jgi:DNA polymerase-3 subunit delta
MTTHDTRFKSVYLIHGDDHGRIAERRARLRLLAEQRSGAQGVELLEGERATPDLVAAALNAMTFAIGRRFIVVDGVERWKDTDLDRLVAAIAHLPPDTTIAFFASEDGRVRAPQRLHEAVHDAGGQIDATHGVKPWELPKWVIERARTLALELAPDAARALLSNVGERPQRLVRELEKLAIDVGAEAGNEPQPVDAELVDEVTAPAAERRSWALADALLAAEPELAIRELLALRAQGERLSGLVYVMSSRLREAHRVARSLERGESAAQVKRTLRMPSRAADRMIANARRVGPDRLRAAICVIADLEAASRGGGRGGAGEDARALLALHQVTGPEGDQPMPRFVSV